MLFISGNLSPISFSFLFLSLNLNCVMTKKERYEFVIDYFQKHLPEAETELDYEDPYELIVAVILSAQCTDKRVNLTTPEIFKRFPNVASLSKTNFDELFPFIKSISYPNNKTKHLIGMAKMVWEEKQQTLLHLLLTNNLTWRWIHMYFV